MRRQKFPLLFTSLLVLLFFSKITHSDPDNNLSFLGNDQYKKIRVNRVISADTIILENDERIKLIGLSAPKPPKPKKIERDQLGFVIEETKPWTSVEEAALLFAQKLMEGKYVRLEFDVQKKDERSQTLAYVFLVDDNQMANSEILNQGYANLQIRPPNIKYAEILREAYKEAKREKRGLQAE